MSLAAALVAAQSEMPRLHKDSEAEVQTKTGGKYKYTYLSLESLLEQVLPVLNKHGLALVQSPCFEDGRQGLETILLHESGEQIGTVMALAIGPDAAAQAQGSAITYARRYSLLAMLGLAPDEDDDGAATQKASAKPQEAAQGQEGPSPAQHARLAILLKEMETKEPKAEGQLSYVEDARNYIKARFGKNSRAQLTVSEMQDLIDEVEGWRQALDIPFGEPETASV